MRHLLASALVCFVFVVSANAAAQTSDIEKAQEHFDQGGKYYFDGEYSDALVEFTKGYALADNPIFLYNISLCHWRMGDYAKAASTAVETLETGKELPPDVDAKVRARLVAFRSQLSGARRAAAVVDDRRAMAQTETQAEPSALAKERADREAPRTLLWTGAVTTVVGAGLLAGFGVVEVGLDDDIEAYRDAAEAGRRAEAEQLAADIEQRGMVGRILLYSGAGLAAVGATLIVVDLASGDEGDVALEVTPTPGGVMSAVRFSFW